MTGESGEPGQAKLPGMPTRPGWPSLIVAGSVALLLAVGTIVTRELAGVILTAAWCLGYCLWFIGRMSAVRTAAVKRAGWGGQHPETGNGQAVSGDVGGN
jgi:hypothetical protein